MKRSLLIMSVLTTALIFSCAGGGSVDKTPDKNIERAPDQREERADTGPFAEIINALKSGDREMLKTFLHPEMNFNISAFEDMIEGEGRDEFIRVFNERLAGNEDFKKLASSGFKVINGPEGENSRELMFEKASELGSPFELMMGVRREGDRWLLRTFILSASVGRPVSLWQDKNKNGRMDDDEAVIYMEQLMMLVTDPHEGISYIDRFFNLNGDSTIDHIEMEIARESLINGLSDFIFDAAPDIAEMIDMNHDRLIQQNEQVLLKDYLFYAPELREPHDYMHPYDEFIDENKDRHVQDDEIRKFADRILITIASVPIVPYRELDTYTNAMMIREWADRNHDNNIDQKEIQSVIFAFSEYFQNPNHVATNPIGQYFDLNRDHIVDFKETQRVRGAVLSQMQKLVNQKLEKPLLDLIDIDGNGKFEKKDKEMLVEFASGRGLIMEHPAEGPVDRILDKNKDGFVNFEELENFKGPFFNILLKSWLKDDLTEFPIAQVMTPLDEFSDTNKDGKVDQMEYIQKMKGLYKPHGVRNPFDKGIDFNGNGYIEIFEIEKAKRAGAVIKEQLAVDADGKYPVKTRADQMMDLNDDKFVTNEEIEKILNAVLKNPDVLKDTNLFGLLDRNGDKALSQDEIITSIQIYFMPHPADKRLDFDKALDTDNDGFINPEEIGIAAGSVEGGFVPNLLERIEQMEFTELSKDRKAFDTEEVQEAIDEIEESSAETDIPEDTSAESSSSESSTAGSSAGSSTGSVSVNIEGSDREVTIYFKKLSDMKGKTMSVSEIEATSSAIADDVTKGLREFIESAFVNISDATIVEREDTEKIYEEYKLQLSGAVDEDTVVEIGKMLGAEILVLSTISEFSDTYYLNIKVIDIETAEILGVSYADAEDESEFVQMCNTAVYMLF